MNSERPIRPALSAALLLLLGLTGASAWAQGFAAYISPPRVTMQAQPAKPQRQVLEIQHAGERAGSYRLYTADWRFNANDTVEFSNELAADSCRPWVALERRELKLEPGERYRFRFELQAPADAPVRECRFAIMVEGLESAAVNQAGLNIPVTGRIGVIVYVAIGGAQPALELVGHRVEPVEGKPTPMLLVRNQGLAHGRLEGFVDGVDADGQKLELSPRDFPILPGETRAIALQPTAPEKKPVPIPRLPLRVKGELEWGRQRMPLDLSFTP